MLNEIYFFDDNEIMQSAEFAKIASSIKYMMEQIESDEWKTMANMVI
jgi:hypothetical protein